ncbi:MAG: tripartite tricarboxylate transporter TctB family protein [Qingshengfaniella sp.]
MTDSDFLSARVRRIASGTLFLAIAVIGFWMLQESRANFTNMIMPADPGPFSLPAICLSLIGLTGLGLLGLGLTTRDSTRQHAGEARFVLPALFLVSLMALPLIMPLLGTALAVGLFSTLWILLLDADLNGLYPRTVIKALIFGAGTGLVIHGLFVRLLTLPLP